MPLNTRIWGYSTLPWKKRVKKKIISLQVLQLLLSVLRIHLVLMRIRILDPHWKKLDTDPDPGHEYFFKIYWICFNNAELSNIFLLVSLIFMLKLDEPFRVWEIFIISLFSTVQIWVLRLRFFCCSFWLIFCPFYLDPHIFADPDPVSTGYYMNPKN